MALASFDGTVLQALLETDTALSAYRQELVSAEAIKRARDNSAQVANQAQRLYVGGRSAYLDTLDAQRSLASAAAMAMPAPVVGSERSAAPWPPSTAALRASGAADEVRTDRTTLSGPIGEGRGSAVNKGILAGCAAGTQGGSGAGPCANAAVLKAATSVATPPARHRAKPAEARSGEIHPVSLPKCMATSRFVVACGGTALFATTHALSIAPLHVHVGSTIGAL